MTLVKGVNHKKRFRIGKIPHGMQSSTYFVITLKANGKPAKRTKIKGEFSSHSDAKFAIRKWDLA